MSSVCQPGMGLRCDQGTHLHLSLCPTSINTQYNRGLSFRGLEVKGDFVFGVLKPHCTPEYDTSGFHLLERRNQIMEIYTAGKGQRNSGHTHLEALQGAR